MCGRRRAQGGGAVAGAGEEEGELSGREGERSGHMWMATPDAVCSDPTGDDT